MVKKMSMDDYKLTASIHTAKIVTKDKLDISNLSDIDKKAINSYSTLTNGSSSLILNLNNVKGNILRFSEYKSELFALLSKLNINTYKIIRLDLRLDNYIEGSFDKYIKLHNYMMAAVSLIEDTKNNYSTVDLFSGKQLSKAVKGDFIEVEYYDRERKSKITGNGKDKAKGRFEIRSKKREYSIWDSSKTNENYDKIKIEFQEEWLNRFNSVSNKLIDVEKNYNEKLLEEYNNSLGDFKSNPEFIRYYKEYYFSRKQTIAFYELINAKNPVQDADNFSKNNDIQYFSKKDVNMAIKEIKRSIKEFFNT